MVLHQRYKETLSICPEEVVSALACRLLSMDPVYFIWVFKLCKLFEVKIFKKSLLVNKFRIQLVVFFKLLKY